MDDRILTQAEAEDLVENLVIICREIDKVTGRIHVYPLKSKITLRLVGRLRHRMEVKQNVSYYGMHSDLFKKNRKKIARILLNRNLDESLLDDIWVIGKIELKK